MTKDKKNSDLSLTIGEKRFLARRIWNPEREEWFYSVTDIIAILVPDSPDPSGYWRLLKGRLKEKEGFDEAVAQIIQYRLKSKDGKFRFTDTANRQTLLRLIQSVPSPQAEPVRLWLAQVGEDRFEEIEHPEVAIERVRATYKAKGYDDAWIDARIKNDLIRNELTDEWKDRGAKEGVEYAILTNELSKGTFGMTVSVYKGYKLLPNKANLRDHMTPIELALTSLSEATSITLHRERDSQGFPELHRDRDTTDAGRSAGKARKALEDDLGRSVVSKENYLKIEKVKGKNKQDQQPKLLDESNEGGL